MSRARESLGTTSFERRARVLVAGCADGLGARILQALAREPAIEVVARLHDVHAAADHPLPVEVAILGSATGEREGLWAARRLRAREPAPAVVLCSSYPDDALAAAAVVAGARGLVGSQATGAELTIAVRRLAAGGCHLPEISPAVVRAVGARLDHAQRSILSLLVQGVPALDAARSLGIGVEDLEAERVEMLCQLAPAVSRPAGPIGAIGPPRRALSG